MSNEKTIFSDIDGTLVKHCGDITLYENPEYELEVLFGVHEKLEEWKSKGYYLVLTTGRRKSLRSATESQLKRAGIWYDDLVMGFGGAPRYAINDTKPNSDDETIFAITVKRNVGIENIKI